MKIHERELGIMSELRDENQALVLKFRSSDADKCGYVQK